MVLDYQNRLFKSSYLRSWYHSSRFYWLNKIINKYNIAYKNVLEIGCGCAKTIEFLNNKPDFYVGIDANWENMLDYAKEKYKNNNYIFIQAINPTNIKLEQNFDLCICMETFEHMDTETLKKYLLFIKQNVKGYFLITVPVEFGVIFLIKFLIKKFIYKDDKEVNLYSLKEVFYNFIGKTDKVQRNYGGHKGFDYRNFVKYLSNYFDIVKIEGIPFKIKFLSPTIGVVCKNE